MPSVFARFEVPQTVPWRKRFYFFSYLFNISWVLKTYHDVSTMIDSHDNYQSYPWMRRYMCRKFFCENLTKTRTHEQKRYLTLMPYLFVCFFHCIFMYTFLTDNIYKLIFRFLLSNIDINKIFITSFLTLETSPKCSIFPASGYESFGWNEQTRQNHLKNYRINKTCSSFDTHIPP